MATKEECPPSEGSYKTQYTLIWTLLLLYYNTRTVHFFLRYLGLPLMVSELLIGLSIGNVPGFTNVMPRSILEILERFYVFAFALYMFVLGLEMNPRAIRKPARREAIIGYAGLISTIIVCTIHTITVPSSYNLSEMADPTFVVSIMLIFANTASPLLTRLTTDLKLGKSDLGRLVIRAAVYSDMVSTLMMCIWFLFLSAATRDGFNVVIFIVTIIMLALQICLLQRVIPRLVDYVNEQNPEGKPMRGSHLLWVFIVLFMLWTLGFFVGFHGTLNAFLMGLYFPREGRLSRILVSKINLALRGVLYPVFFFTIGMKSPLDTLLTASAWRKLVNFLLIGTLGKVSGTIIAATRLGFNFPEALGMGLLMNLKGHYHIFAAMDSTISRSMTTQTWVVLLIHILISIFIIPVTVKMIIRRAKRRAAQIQMALQWQDPSAELRLMMGLHGQHNLASTINIIEVSRGGKGGSPLVVYAMDMIELTNEYIEVHREAKGEVSVDDEQINRTRIEIANTIQEYVREKRESIKIHRLLTIANFEDMHMDIFNEAQCAKASLIILPFHKRRRVDGGLEDSRSFREVNKKVLETAPCSVGIFVDRGLGGADQMAAYALQPVAVIFIGGCDDREALSYASRMAYHPGVKLTAIRFLADESAESVISLGESSIYSGEDELSIDDDYFMEFYDRHVAGGPVSYLEKYVSSGAETLSNIRILEAQYLLFIVGLAGRRSPVMTRGMSSWMDCPELGPVGDTLAASDFSVSASVLIIQQHNPRKQPQTGDSLTEFSTT